MPRTPYAYDVLSSIPYAWLDPPARHLRQSSLFDLDVVSIIGRDGEARYDAIISEEILDIDR